MANLGGLLPPIGLEIPCSMYTTDALLKIGAKTATLEMMGGIRFRVEANRPEGLGGVKLKIIGFELRDRSTLGGVTLSQEDADAPLSSLEITGDSPPRFTNRIVINTCLTIEKPPSGGTQIRVVNTNTTTLVKDNLTVFPPQGVVYKLEGPVDFATAGATDKIVATLQSATFMMSHNP
jgi:hypothetical protein